VGLHPSGVHDHRNSTGDATASTSIRCRT
jgi:hypothetical protein